MRSGQMAQVPSFNTQYHSPEEIEEVLLSELENLFDKPTLTPV